MHIIKLKEEDRFVFNGLDDYCFMIVNQIELHSDINVPVMFNGTVYQVNIEDNTFNKLGDDYVIQASMTVDAVFDMND